MAPLSRDQERTPHGCRAADGFIHNRQFVYAHEWRVNDLVMWDKRTVMHRASRFDDLKEVRDLRRTSHHETAWMSLI